MPQKARALRLTALATAVALAASTVPVPALAEQVDDLGRPPVGTQSAETPVAASPADAATPAAAPPATAADAAAATLAPAPAADAADATLVPAPTADAATPAVAVPAPDVYTVTEPDGIAAVLDQIRASGAYNAVIELDGTYAKLPGNELGIPGVHLTLRSSEAGGEQSVRPSDATLREGYAVYLTGDVTFQNVSVTARNVFAQGHTLEFGESYDGYGLRVYGGSDHDLDLHTNGDADGSTHVIVRAGSFFSIVGGNKDTFDQPADHEYADWASHERNRHTTLVGNVLVDVYGGVVNGSYNIDAGDTCCNTSVTPVALYGGGLGSDTRGNVTVNVYGYDGGRGAGRPIFGGGFGIGGGENDPTLHDDAVKHTGVVYGDVSLNLLGGQVGEFYGGGRHGGSAFRRNVNVTGERTAQLAHNRDKVAVVTGDVDVALGGDVQLCVNTASGFGGSYASTIGGDVTLTVRDQAKLACRAALSNPGGAPTPQSMDDLHNTYAKYYDGMHPGYGWRNQLSGTGQWDVVRGTVNVNLEGGYGWTVCGTSREEPLDYSSLDVPSATVLDEKGTGHAVNLNVSGGMFEFVNGVSDMSSADLSSGVSYRQSGGQVLSATLYDGHADYVRDGGSVDAVVSGGGVYALTGMDGRLPANVSSRLDFLPAADGSTVGLGYVAGFGDVVANEDAHVRVDSVALLGDAFGIAPESFGASGDVPFYENVVNLTLEPRCLLTTADNGDRIELLGDVANHGGMWESLGCVTVDGSLDASGGQLFFARPTLVRGDATWDGSAWTLLALPAVDGNNYDGTDATQIPLRVDGTSSGTAFVRTVDGIDWRTGKMPAVGDNYVLSARVSEKDPVRATYTLVTKAAVEADYYLSKLDDFPGSADGTHALWQVAVDTDHTVEPPVYPTPPEPPAPPAPPVDPELPNPPAPPVDPDQPNPPAPPVDPDLPTPPGPGNDGQAVPPADNGDIPAHGDDGDDAPAPEVPATGDPASCAAAAAALAGTAALFAGERSRRRH